ncbi:MAG: Coat F domain protein [Pelotomaculum sp. PtaB.Bin104]|nr:MAG: Coat F domain protein [Pelotomaculum sp. PtaB.Bin104]
MVLKPIINKTVTGQNIKNKGGKWEIPTVLKLNDQVLANDALMALKGASAAYLNATLESATPEVRSKAGNSHILHRKNKYPKPINKLIGY